DFRKWAAAFQRSFSINNYLDDHLDDAALREGPLADPKTAAETFSADLKAISTIRAAGAVSGAITKHLTDQAVGLVGIPDAVRTDKSLEVFHQYPLAQYAFVFRQRGPAETDE